MTAEKYCFRKIEEKNEKYCIEKGAIIYTVWPRSLVHFYEVSILWNFDKTKNRGKPADEIPENQLKLKFINGFS